MKVAIISPISVLKKYAETADKYHLILTHLVKESREYASFYRGLAEKGHHIILDNSVHELGEPGTVDDLVQTARITKATEIALPDQPFNARLTLRKAQQAYSSFKEELPTISIMGIPQGNDVHELLWCLQGLVNLGVNGINTIGLTNDYEIWGGGLLKLIREIRCAGFYHPIHILGWSRDIYALSELGRFSNDYNIYGVDSAKPLVFAHHKIVIPNSPFRKMLEYPGRPENFFDLSENDIDPTCAVENIKTFKALAEGKINVL